MKAVSFSDFNHSDWDRFVEKSPDSWFFHYSHWILIESQFFVKKNLSFAVIEHDEILAICPLYLRILGRGWEEKLVDSGHHRHAGIAFSSTLSAQQYSDCKACLMEHIFAVSKDHNANRILLNSHNLALSNINAGVPKLPFWIAEYGFHAGMMFTENGELSCPNFSTVCADQLVDLTKSLDELLENTESSFRRALRKANQGSIYTSDEQSNALGIYYELVKTSSKRTGESVLPKEYFNFLFNSFEKAGRLKVLFVYKGAMPVAGILLLIEKGSCNFFGGVSHPDYLKFRVNDFIHWEAIRWAKEKGFLRYRLGPIFPTLPKTWNVCKVSRFKKKLGGDSVNILQGSYYLSPHKYIDDANTIISKLYTVEGEKTRNLKDQTRDNLELILNSYGFFGAVQCSNGEIQKYKKIVERIVEFKQGDPSKVQSHCDKSRHGFDFERPFYLYEDLIHQECPSKPLADILGFDLATAFSQKMNIPLVEVLPNGLKGLIIVTGDDDQAYLEKYDEQLNLLNGVPITYFLHPLTKHTSSTLSEYSDDICFGIHPDALECPSDYQKICVDQTNLINSLLGTNVKSVRNHGFLSDGYQGHLKVWEKLSLLLDLNIPGVDGTAVNGSYLPMRVRREDGSWSDHYTLLTTFGDGMIFALGMTERQAVLRIKKTVKQIEKSNPGVLVFNLHPQNIDKTRKIHKYVVKLAKRRGWKAMGVNSYLDWLLARETLTISAKEDKFILYSPTNIKDVVLKYWRKNKWVRKTIPPFTGKLEVKF